jgi:DNA-3-methyladenine glycosylase I
MQAGLNWLTVLKKREHYRSALDDFDPESIAEYDENKFNALMANEGLIRNRLKIQSIITNARAFLQTKQDVGDFSNYLWQFVEGKPITHHWQTSKEIPARSDLSDAMAKDLKQKGFKFVGSTICYALMQATGMVNDHITTCFCYQNSLL